ncbi:MAG: RT0821/Lpp0805 family surface protein [Pseudomonadota bacterium]|nr:RT0821/Lpp0805 family surface protein [Pseudomonadota bacterium]
MTGKSRKAAVAALLVLSLAAAGCQNMGTKQTVGTGLGAVAGGLLGSQIGGGSGRLWATGAGVLLGALVGSGIGESLDNADMAAMNSAQSQAYTAPVGQQISWSNPQSGNYGTYTPVREGYDRPTGAYCREYQQTINVGGRTERGYGTACRQPDGTWQVVN